MHRKKNLLRLGMLHLLLLAGIALFPLYRRGAELLPSFFTRCWPHDRLFLYCPLCGGTRALSELLQLHFLEALRYNAFVVLLVAALILLDLVAWYRAWSGKRPLLSLPGWFWIVLICLMLAFGVVRNLLMIFGNYDPVGDLGLVWRTLLK
ncbi:MAG: DUF2752 domain-containing protein [Clostridia bacterium]|nr:DUF2752 domain-containing protein [Clostridia bacterium]